VRAELGIPPDAWVVGTVGRLAPEKDQTLLVRAMAPLLDERRQLVILGDGPERGALEASVAATFRPEFCHLLGSRPDTERYLAAFDAFALSSKTEGLPLALLEAMATGVPVVSTAVGGIPDVLQPGVTGVLVPAGDHQALFRQLLFLVNYPTAALRMGARGRELVHADYSVGGMAERYQSLYETLVRRTVEREPMVAGSAP
jgi:glycosyltransferase involved in cell wall biosynthesis